MALWETPRLFPQGHDIVLHDNLRNALCALLYWHPLEPEEATSLAFERAATADAMGAHGYERNAFEAVVATACQTHSPVLQENVVRVVLRRLDTTTKPKEDSVRCSWSMLAKTRKDDGGSLGAAGLLRGGETLRNIQKDREGCFLDVLFGCLGPRAEEHERSSAARRKHRRSLCRSRHGAGGAALSRPWKRELLGAVVKAALLSLAADSATKMLLHRVALAPVTPNIGAATRRWRT